MMKFFNKKKELRISRNVTAMDGRVIARKGDRIDANLVNQLPQQQTGAVQTVESLGESQHFFNFKILIAEPKYWCVPDFTERKDLLLKIFSSISINQSLMKELTWLERYGYHYDHILAVTAFVTCMCLDFYDNEPEVCQATLCALIHDIGITRVPEDIFLKLAILERREREILHQHPIYSYILLSYYGYGSPNMHANIALEHHEDSYGRGYPRGLVPAHYISLMIRMADMFDALITTRPYRPAQSPTTAMETLARQQEPGDKSWEVYSLLKARVQPHHVAF